MASTNRFPPGARKPAVSRSGLPSGGCVGGGGGGEAESTPLQRPADGQQLLQSRSLSPAPSCRDDVVQLCCSTLDVSGFSPSTVTLGLLDLSSDSECYSPRTGRTGAATSRKEEGEVGGGGGGEEEERGGAKQQSSSSITADRHRPPARLQAAAWAPQPGPL